MADTKNVEFTQEELEYVTEVINRHFDYLMDYIIRKRVPLEGGVMTADYEKAKFLEKLLKKLQSAK